MFSRCSAVMWLTVAIAPVVVADGLDAQATAGVPAVYEDVWVRFSQSAKDIRMVTDKADLVMDAARSRLVVKNKKRPLDVAFADIKGVVFDASTHMRGGNGGGGFGGLIGAAVAASVQGGAVTDYWCVIDYAGPNGQVERYLLEVDKEQAPAVLAKMKELLPDKVQEARFEERQREVPKEELKPFEDDYTVTVKKEQRPPVPGVRGDKALVVVVCPAVDTADTGRGGQYRLYANGQIVAVNKMGTYNYAFLDPGRYTLRSKAGNVGELVIELQAGKEYYFFQNTFMGFASAKNTLTRQSKELVTYELTGTYHSEWQPKTK
jgi:hypothetical protein